MALETGTFISDLVATNPVGSDPLAFADDHIRLVKSTIKNTFPNISGAVTKTHTEINTAVDQAGAALARTGGTMTGALVLAANPSTALQAAPKQYVDAQDTAAISSAVSQAAAAAAVAHPTKTGSGASGTWGINISGNAATATTAANGGVTSVNGQTGAVTVGSLGVGQNWSSPSRSAGVWYQNTTGKPIMVNIVFGGYGAGYLYVGPSTSSYGTANWTDNDIYQINAMSGVVPDGYYYQCTGGFAAWYELR